jgi:hypothetical protein
MAGADVPVFASNTCAIRPLERTHVTRSALWSRNSALVDCLKPSAPPHVNGVKDAVATVRNVRAMSGDPNGV